MEQKEESHSENKQTKNICVRAFFSNRIPLSKKCYDDTAEQCKSPTSIIHSTTSC